MLSPALKIFQYCHRSKKDGSCQHADTRAMMLSRRSGTCKIARSGRARSSSTAQGNEGYSVGRCARATRAVSELT